MTTTPFHENGHNAPPPPKPRRTAADRAVFETRGVRSRRRPVYSRFVRIMRVALPMTALLVIALIVIWPQLRVAPEGFSLNFTGLSASSAENPSMINARFVGTDRKNQPFSITADLAKNLLLGTASVELELPKADISIDGGTWIVLTANNGVFHQKDRRLSLKGKVNLFHDSGYEFKTEAADIDLNAGLATGNQPVQGQGPFGQLRSEGFRITDSGKRMIFTGKAKLVIRPGALEALN